MVAWYLFGMSQLRFYPGLGWNLKFIILSHYHLLRANLVKSLCKNSLAFCYLNFMIGPIERVESNLPKVKQLERGGARLHPNGWSPKCEVLKIFNVLEERMWTHLLSGNNSSEDVKAGLESNKGRSEENWYLKGTLGGYKSTWLHFFYWII